MNEKEMIDLDKEVTLEQIAEMKKWYKEINTQINSVDSILLKYEKSIQLNDLKMNIIHYSENYIGIASERIEKHWQDYGEPLNKENERLIKEREEKWAELRQKKKSLEAIKISLEEFFKRNDVNIEL